MSKLPAQDLAKASLVTSSKEQKQGLPGDTGHAQELKGGNCEGMTEGQLDIYESSQGMSVNL